MVSTRKNRFRDLVFWLWALIRIKSPYKMGKTYLINRIFDHVKQKGYRTVYINLWSQENLTDLKTFLQRFCAILSS